MSRPENPRRTRPLLPLLDRTPPYLCRLLARKNKGCRLKSQRDISFESGLDLHTVCTLTYKTSWRGVRIEVYDAFTRACGVSPLRFKDHRDYLKRGKKMALLKANREQKKMIMRLFAVAGKLSPEGRPV